MDRGLAVIVMAGTGRLIAHQPAINAGLSRNTGSIAAAFVSFAVGTLVLALIVAASGQVGGLSSTFDVRWYYLLGGVVGAVWIASSLIADRLGVLGLTEMGITPARILGVGLPIVGTYLVVR
jgi:bacterial/archaeal transporter family-2 protein